MYTGFIEFEETGRKGEGKKRNSKINKTSYTVHL